MLLKNIDFNELAILVDFDGTITTKDTNNKLVEVYGNDNNKQIQKNLERESLIFHNISKGKCLN